MTRFPGVGFSIPLDGHTNALPEFSSKRGHPVDTDSDRTGTTTTYYYYYYRRVALLREPPFYCFSSLLCTAEAIKVSASLRKPPGRCRFIRLPFWITVAGERHAVYSTRPRAPEINVRAFSTNNWINPRCMGGTNSKMEIATVRTFEMKNKNRIVQFVKKNQKQKNTFFDVCNCLDG